MEIFLHAKYLYPSKKYKTLLKTTFLLLIFIPFASFSQTVNNTATHSKIYGKVLDGSTKEPIAGAVVRIKDGNKAIATNALGEFILTTDQSGPYTLLISFIGYDKAEIKVTDQPVTVSLKPSLGQLNDVVVVGYGTQKKEDLTGSISKINTAEISKIPVASFDAQLQGQAAGVQVTNPSGVPGESIFVRVRGTTSINSSSDPLYIVDGVFLNNTSLQTLSLGGETTSPLADINPADIQSIEILKDASATAIYGSRGANGVVLVTTKHGSFNAAPKVTFDASNGWVQADKSTLPKMVTGPEGAELANEYWVNSGIDNPALNQTVANEPFRSAATGGQGTPAEQQTYDRMDDLLQHGSVQDYNLGIQGGSATSKYYIGGGYTDQNALIKVLNFSRESLKFNFDQDLSKSISVGISNDISRSYRSQAFDGDGPQVNLWNAAVSAATYTPKYATDGTSTGADNIYTLMANYDVHTISLRYIGSLYAQAKITDGLTFKTTFSMDYDHYDESAYWDTETSIGKAVNGEATSALTQNSTWINEQTLTYQKNFGVHHLNFLLGNSFQSNLITLTSAQGTGFANDDYTDISSASVRTAGETWTKNTLASFFGRFDYNIASKYYFDASMRADGSSKFGANNKWGYFPAFSVGWRLKDEAFLKDVNWLSDLKFRASYGITGNESGANNFAAKGLWAGGSSYADVNGTPLPGTGPSQLGNPNLKWEQTAQTDLGFDASLFNSRVNVTFDVYDKNTTNLLLQAPIPTTTGFPSYWANAGSMSNKGYEVGINTTNIQTKSFSWKTGLNFAGNVNKITKLPTAITDYTRNWVIMQQGYSMNSYWLYKQTGVNPQTGAVIFAGQAADGTVSAADRQIIGSVYPKVYGGINNNFNYKNFDLGLLFTFQYGNKELNLNRYFRERNPSSGGVDTYVLNRWTTPGQITDIPRLTSVGNNYGIDNSTRYLEDASFLRLKELTFGYTLPESIVSKLKVSNIRVYFVGSNLFLWTKYDGDPESSVTADPNAQGLGSFGVPPQPKSFQFGLNVTF
jgi:TonB-linked SusC/RagA family outer membrane protein